MTERENFLSIAKRTGYDYIPSEFNMCPSLQEKYNNYCIETGFKHSAAAEYIDNGRRYKTPDKTTYVKYYDVSLKEGTTIDMWGVAHEPGSKAAMHMTRMHHPMKNFDSVQQIFEYPFPQVFAEKPASDLKSGKAKIGGMQCTIWETAWYMRGMEQLMMDMMSDDDMATVLLDKVTDFSTDNAIAFVKAGADCLFLGDDIGMQHTIMMSEELYCQWLKPRTKKIIDSARAINPNIVIFYHSCGYVEPFIPHFIEIGIDVLNPVQPECMNFEKLHSDYGGAISFHGTIGTQSTMPFGTPEDVKREVSKNLDIAGKKGGLFPAPTHMLEPEVPLENVIAYIEACQNY